MRARQTRTSVRDPIALNKAVREGERPPQITSYTAKARRPTEWFGCSWQLYLEDIRRLISVAMRSIGLNYFVL